MAHGSQTLIDDRHQRTVFIIALITGGVLLFAAIVWLSLCVPLAIENEGNLIEGPPSDPVITVRSPRSKP